MRIVIVAGGKLKEPALRQLVDQYLTRIRRYASCEEIEVRDRAGFSRAIVPGATLVTLEVDGESLSSQLLSEQVARWSARGKGIVVFAIGDAEGLPDALRARADFRLSLSSLTLPHRIARLLLVEQIYRAFSILRGEPYAREG